MEFYHEFRRLWDKAVPVQRGLGHVMHPGRPGGRSRTPDLLFWQLGETRPARSTSRRGRRSRSPIEPRRSGRGPDTRCARIRIDLGYPVTVSVVVGKREAIAIGLGKS